MSARIIPFICLLLYGHNVVSQEQITILYTNDIHGNYLQKEAKKTETRGEPIEYGGVSLLNANVKRVARTTKNNYLLFDAGDFMTVDPICDIEYQGVKGGALIYFLNYIGYIGLILGNHEFDISVENCQGLFRL